MYIDIKIPIIICAYLRDTAQNLTTGTLPCQASLQSFFRKPFILRLLCNII